jgi:hypothetical protein
MTTDKPGPKPPLELTLKDTPSTWRSLGQHVSDHYVAEEGLEDEELAYKVATWVAQHYLDGQSPVSKGTCKRLRASIRPAIEHLGWTVATCRPAIFPIYEVELHLERRH